MVQCGDSTVIPKLKRAIHTASISFLIIVIEKIVWLIPIDKHKTHHARCSWAG